MKRSWIPLVLAAALVAGCNGAGGKNPSLGPLASPHMAGGTAPSDSGSDVPSSGISPARAADAPVARVREPQGQAPPAPRPGEDNSKLDAKLDEVNLPLKTTRPPVLVPAGEGDAPRLVDTVLAEVNGEVVTREDILGPLRPQMEQWRKTLTPSAFDSQCRTVVEMKLREAVSMRLVVQEAKARLTEDERKQVEKIIEQTVKNMVSEAGSMQALEERLAKKGSSVEKEKQRETDRLTVQRYLREKVAPTIHVTHSELLEYYKRVRAERFEEPERMRLALVVIKKSKSANIESARALAGAVLERAKAGEDFARLAERYSEDPMADKGGDWGLLGRGSFRVKAVDAVLFTLQAGQVGPIVEADDAFYIIKATERHEARTVPFVEVQSALEDEMREDKYKEQVGTHVQGLYERAYVRIHENNL
ncbi:MAG: peptidylprolyl isomerase [Planctomycetota bacterium]|nr:peptidylprolyl isomerase [Planctomycetota bacterium]